jgi:hypothetical protein
MTHAIVKLSIPFEVLVEAVCSLNDEEKQTLRQILDQDSNSAEATQPDQSWASLMTFIEESAVDTGIEDLAYQHDHYIHGTPKRALQPE